MTTENHISDNNEKDLEPLKQNVSENTQNETANNETEPKDEPSAIVNSALDGAEEVSETVVNPPQEEVLSNENLVEKETFEAEKPMELEKTTSLNIKETAAEKVFPIDANIKSESANLKENQEKSGKSENDFPKDENIKTKVTKIAEISSEKITLIENHLETELAAKPEQNTEKEKKQDKNYSLEELLNKLETIVNAKDGGSQYKEFNNLKEQIQTLIQGESILAKGKLSEEEQEFYKHPLLTKFNGFLQNYREKQNEYHKKLEIAQNENLKTRQAIIDRLKNLYTNSEAGTNLVKEIREIKQDWGNAGQVGKNEFKLLNNNYYFHLQQFYEMLDLNKEFLTQEYEHNLEKRKHIITRSKELLEEKSVQKALNELQYLHKLWKEEAVPVAEEFREATWLEFKEISNKIHDRKAELFTQIDAEQNETLVKKNDIIAKMKVIVTPEKELNHNYWQQSIKKIEDLRSEFLKLGSVPKKLSNQNWAEFKEMLKQFNSKKNDFYKGLKHSQQDNLDKKLSLIKTATDNMNSEDWETTVPLFKNLQNEWKKIGHVPRSQADKIWADFRAACNTFFENFRKKNDVASDNWKENLNQKNELLSQLKTITDEDGSVEKIEELKNNWNKIGKVPRENLGINTEFNKTLRDKLKLNKINEYDLKEEGLSESQLSDKARKIKNQISDMESEIVKMENNLGFFADSSRNNPLLKETFVRIDEKKAQLESMKVTLHQIISGE